MQKDISVRVHIPLSRIEDMLSSARQGTQYWVNLDPETDNGDGQSEVSGLFFLDYENEVKNFMQGKLEVFVFDGEDNDKKHVLNIRKIKHGLTVMAKKYPHHFKDVMDDNADMITADVLVQCALFGDVLYS